MDVDAEGTTVELTPVPGLPARRPGRRRLWFYGVLSAAVLLFTGVGWAAGAVAGPAPVPAPARCGDAAAA